MKKSFLSLFMLSACLLSGCVFIAGGAVIASAAYVAHDHRTLMQEQQDQFIQQNIVKKLNDNKTINQPNTYIYVTVFYDQVLLTGQVPNANIKQLAGKIAADTPKMRIVYNQLDISGASSDLTRMSDSWISTKIKMRLLTIKDLKTSEVSIMVNDGVVYVLGHNLDSRKMRWVADTAKKVDGVQKVVLCAGTPKPKQPKQKAMQVIDN